MNLFISFDWDDRDQVNGFRSMLSNDNVEDIFHRDVSIKHDYSKNGKKAIKREILKKIKTAKLTVCLISETTKNSRWVNWELEQSRLKGVPIVGIVLKNQSVKELNQAPEFFTRYKKYNFYSWVKPKEIDSMLQKTYRDD